MRTRCPACGASAGLDVLVAHEDARAAMASVFKLSGDLGSAMVRYLGLFRPAQRELTMARVATLVGELLPHLASGAIPRKGRQWAVTPADWCAAIEALIKARDAGKLTLPMAGHGYLLEVLAGIAERKEREQEQALEAARRHGSGTGTGTGNTSVRTGPMELGQVLQTALQQRHPALLKLDADARAAAPMPDDVRAKLAALRAKSKEQAP
jgi:hypothetical protein